MYIFYILYDILLLLFELIKLNYLMDANDDIENMMTPEEIEFKREFDKKLKEVDKGFSKLGIT